MSTVISSVEVGLEVSGFADVDPLTKAPNYPNGITFVPLGARRAAFLDGVTEAGLDFDATRSGAYDYPPEVPSVVNRSAAGALWGAALGEPIPAWRGDITLDMIVYGIGDGATFATYNALPLTMLWQSSLGSSAPSDATDAVSVIGGVNTYTPTTLGEYDEGRGIVATIDNAAEYAIVTGLGGGVVTYSPATSAALGLAAVVRHCHTLFPQFGSAMSSVALRFNWLGCRAYAFGCRMRSLKLTFEANVLKATMVMSPAVILRDDAAAALATWVRPSGIAANWHQAYHLLSPAVVGSTSPAAVGRSALVLHSWEADINFTLASAGGAPESIVGRANTNVTDVAMQVTTQSEPNAVVEAMYRKREARFLSLGCGPADAGQGFALMVPAAHLMSTSSPTAEGEDNRRVQPAVFRPGAWTLDTGSGGAADTAFRLLLPV